MNNILSYCGLVDVRINVSDKDLPVQSSAQEEAILKTVLDEMAQFYDVVNDREFKQIEQKYASSRMVLIKVCEKIEEMDG